MRRRPAPALRSPSSSSTESRSIEIRHHAVAEAPRSPALRTHGRLRVASGFPRFSYLILHLFFRSVAGMSCVLCFFLVLLDLFDRLSQSSTCAARFLQPLLVDYCITAALQQRFGSFLLSVVAAA